MAQPFFDDSLPHAARVVGNVLPDVPADELRFVRDMTGRLFVIVPDAIDGPVLDDLRDQLERELGPYSPGREAKITRRGETLSPESLFAEPALLLYVDDRPVHLIERRALGQDWVVPPGAQEQHPPRVTFYSLKGGVGRTTALLLWARELVAKGQKVLLVDLDLEAPGVAAHILPDEERPAFGVVDWLVEDLVGRADEEMLRELCRESSLADSPGLLVVPAAGTQSRNHPDSYIAKLARVYLEGNTDEQPGFAQRIRRMLEGMERTFTPDIVLLDSRAGLHESAPATVLHMDAEVLLFAVDLPATWEGYRFLLGHLKHVAQTGSRNAPIDRDWRERLKMVHARAGETEEEARHFVSNSYGLWIDTLYDELAPDLDAVPENAFSFEENDEAAPHWPLTVLRSDRFERFSPLLHLSQVGERAIREVFGSFFDGLTARVMGSPDDE